MSDPSSFCQNAAANFVGNLFSGIFTLITKPIILVIQCDNNVDYLKNKVAELKDKRETAKKYAETVQRRGEEIVPELRNWLTRADNCIEAAEKLVADAAEKLVADAEGNASKKCFFGPCLTPKSRYQLSKNAEENSKTIDKLVDEAREFNLPLSHIRAPPKEVAAPVKGFEDFYSRKDVLERIMEALQSRSSSIIGVHGMPGMGKTMLAKEIKRKAEQDKLFDVVVMALVSKEADWKKIQVEIARGLGLDQLPNGIKTQDAAELIKDKLKNMKKVLIILDDIWRPGIDLEELGIPLRNEPKTIEGSSSGEENVEGSSSREEHVECKILLTSRDSDVLSDLMDSPLNFFLHQLESGEAWELLKKIVGDRAESKELHDTAIEIVRECGGLPLAITTMAKALKNKEPYQWRDALRKLRKPSSENFHGIPAEVYSAIEVSYSHLETEKLQETFLLCCLMGHEASIEDLLKYGVGLGLFANTIEEARDEVFTSIRTLKASSLLIDDCDNDSFDMHDLAQDVAVSIACRNRHGLLLTGDHAPRECLDMEAMKDFKWIWLEKANINELPDEFESPQLTFFCLNNEDPSLKIPADFFKGMPRLKVLDLTHMHLSSLPSSICLLQNLHTLCLDQSVLGDIRTIGELKNLEILSLGWSEFEELPREIGQLTQLKLLDLSDCTKLKIIPPCVLASMSILEELYLGNSFHGWEVEENENQRNASLAELKHLKKLTNLEVCIPDIRMIPKDLFFENLKKFKIFIGSKWEDQYSSFGGSRILKLHLNASINSNDLVKMLLKKTEELHLRELAGVENVVDELNREGFPDSKRLYVRNAPEVQHIIKSAEGVPFNAFPSLEVLFLQNLINLEKIFQGRFRDTAFNNLRTITIECCDKVKNLFSSSIARQLFHLQEISVTGCSNMEEIVDGRFRDTAFNNLRTITIESTELKFGEVLRSLRLQRLPRLSSLNKSCRHMPLFNEQVAFPNLEELQLSWINVNTIWHVSISSSHVAKLRKLIIEGCDNLEYLFTSSVARDLVMLEHLKIGGCKKMGKVLFIENVEENGNLIFPQLRILEIQGLPKLERFCHGNYIKFPCLSQLLIMSCPVLKTFISSSSSFDTGTLPLFDAKVTFPKLEQLTIEFMESLDKIWDNQLDTVYRCEQVQIFASELSSFPRTNGDDQLEVSLFWTSKVGYRGLENLKLSEFPELIEIWNKKPQEILPFKRLRSLEVCNFNSFRYLLTTSMALGLTQLWDLKVANCAAMEQVIIGEGAEELFPNLYSIILESCPNLKCFYEGNSGLVFPLLNKITVVNCPVLAAFAASFSSDQKTEITTNDAESEESPVIRTQPFFSDKVAFPNLQELEVSWINLSPVFPSTDILAKILKSLEVLSIYRCGLVEGIFEIGEFNVKQTHVAIDTKLRQLNIGDLPRLKHVWNKDPQGILTFHNLESVMCGLKEIVTMGERGTEAIVSFEFPQVTSLKLEFLPRLQCFYPGKHTTKWPMLKVFCFSLFNQINRVDGHGQLDFPIRLPLFSAEKIIPQLEKLSLARHDIVMIREHESKQDILFNGEVLQIQDYLDDELDVLPIGFLKRFYRLENLIVRYCNFKELFPSKGEVEEQEKHVEIEILSRIKTLNLVTVYHCPKLKIFSEGDLNTPLLQRVSIEEEDKCRWEGDLNTTIQKIYMEKDGFAGLQALMLSDFPKLMETWHVKNPQELLDFRQLQVLEICNCSKFSHSLELPRLSEFIVKDCPKMVTCAVSTSSEEHDKEEYQYLLSSKTFEQLNWLEIQDCNMMEEVILAEESMDEEKMGKIFFPNLEFLLLQDPPKLTRFCYGNYLELPCLWKLKITKCPMLKTFISSFIFGDMIANSEVKNTCTLSLFDAKVAFPKLERLVIEHVKSLNKIWNDQLKVDSFCRLTLVSVVSCGKLMNIFPFSMVERFQRLDKLQIWNCDSLEEILESQEPSVSQSQAQKGTPLPLLETITCLEDDVKDGIVFSKLKYLQLCGLPRLSSFCSVNCKFEFPFLKEVILMDCPSMQTFSMDEIRMPKLQKVKLTGDEDEGFWDGNLNSTIQLWFMQKVILKIEIKEIVAHVLSK
ncbi:hypothetical protein SLEP1_g37000 [Rubroshorea leprosula]|uniref:AAA+ ATPase domain-containing protein n=1 Tax=Rubroshorea leprosula TaxID=152421 RepID=A0AAV5KTB9_9ROSI|nr:hypothetical protein SLEP1_g37000 [Rubroshorea leprosula]